MTSLAMIEISSLFSYADRIMDYRIFCTERKKKTTDETLLPVLQGEHKFAWIF